MGRKKGGRSDVTGSGLSEDSLVGTMTAARLLRVDPTTIQRWIDTELITGYRTAGGHRRVMAKDLVRFAKSRGIPLAASKIKASSKPRELDEPGNGAPVVLIVDDEPEILEVLAVRVKGTRPTVEVMTAEDGFRAGFLVQKYRPRLVLLDIRLPGLNGIEVCRLIKSDPETASIHVVGVTATPDMSEMEALIQAGAEEVLRKPVEKYQLERLLSRIFPPRAKARKAG
jgi:excisionase family DNA binding protein